MDGVHAFGPGSIGWALTEHYWLTGDTDWLKAAAPRIKANAEWMLRQRQVVAQAWFRAANVSGARACNRRCR